jgi:hypothetical protein
LSTRDPHIIGVERTHYLPGIRRAVVVTTIEEELVHQVIDVMFPHWDSRPGLSPMRPCRPAGSRRTLKFSRRAIVGCRGMRSYA